MEFLHTLNQRLFLLINAVPDAHPASLVFAVLIAEYLTGIILVFIVLYLIFRHRRSRALCLNVMLSLVLGMAATYLIRKGWFVERPFDVHVHLGTNFLQHSASSSFPSKHMTSLASPLLSMCLLAQTRLVGMIGLLGAAAVAWSRVYLGVHWPLDMAGALLVGLTAALAVKHGFRAAGYLEGES